MIDFLQKLDLTEDQQTAFLNILKAKSLLEAEKIWEAVHVIDNFQISKTRIVKDIIASLPQNNDFNCPEESQKFLNISYLSIGQKIDIITYLVQSVFHRKKGQEVGEIGPNSQKDDPLLLESFKKLGLLNEVTPKNEDFNFIFVLGAGRSTFTKRAQYFKIFFDKYRDINKKFSTKNVLFLTGDRDLSVEIDSLNKSDRDAEGYLKDLAKKHGIGLLEGQEFVKEPMSSKTLANYSESTDIKLNETLMVKDSVQSIFGKELANEFRYINSTKQADGSRPNTLDTIRDAFTSLKTNGELNKDIKILVISNQPHTLRQQLSVDSVFKSMNLAQEGYSLEVLGAGEEFKCNTVTMLESVFASLIFEKRRYFSLNEGEHQMCADNKIMYKGREQLLLEVPTFKQSYILENTVGFSR